MSDQQSAIPEDLRELSGRLEQWRKEQPPRARLPESMWAAAAGMAQRHGLHRTSKVLRLDYVRLKKRLPATSLAKTATTATEPPTFMEVFGSSANGPAECVVEWESARGRMRVAMKGVTPDWVSLLRAWREG